MKGLVLAALALLAGCATPPTNLGGPWTSGRLSVRVAATASQAAQSSNANFELRGNSERGELRLNTPLGTQVAEVRWAPGLALLIKGADEQRFDSLEALSRQALGENLPLVALPDWLAGRPWPGAPHQLREGGFDQLGWTVQLARRAEGWVEASRSAPPAVAVRVKLDSPE